MEHKPTVFIQASAVGYYGCQPANRRLCETSAAGDEFMSELCSRWERASAEIEAMHIRRVILRLGLVFGGHGGALPMLLRVFRWGLGIRLGDGKQPLSWIHLADVLLIISRTLSDPSLSGVYNAVAPETATQDSLAKVIGGLLHRPVWLRLPAGLLSLLFGEMSRLFTQGQRVQPVRLQQQGFRFAYPTLTQAIRQIIGAES